MFEDVASVLINKYKQKLKRKGKKLKGRDLLQITTIDEVYDVYFIKTTENEEYFLFIGIIDGVMKHYLYKNKKIKK